MTIRLPLASLAAVVALAVPTPTMIASGQTETARRAVLRWSGPVAITVDSAPEETVIRFDRPLSAAALDAFKRAAGDAIDRLAWNDNSLVISAAGGATVAVAVQRDGAIVRFVPAAGTTAAATPPADDEIDYALAAAATDRAAGYPGRSRDRLAMLRRAHPDDPRVLRAIADADAADNVAIRAAAGYRQLGAADATARDVIRDAGGDASLAISRRAGSGFAQTDIAARLAAPVSNTVQLAATLRHVATRSDIVIDRDGTARAGDGRRTLVEGAATWLGAGTLRSDVATVIDTRHPRFNLRTTASIGAADRQARILLAYRIPEVATAEQALFRGYATRAGAGATVRLSPAAQVQLDGAVNRYGLTGEPRLVDSVTIVGGLDYVLLRQHPDLSFVYRVDAEYVGRQVRRPGGSPALAYVDRENHSAQLLVARNVQQIRLALAGGWTVDRYGTDGPLATATAQGRIGGGWRFELVGGVTSVRQPNLSGTRFFARGALTRSLGGR